MNGEIPQRRAVILVLTLIVLVSTVGTGGYALGYFVDVEPVGTETDPNRIIAANDFDDGESFGNAANDGSSVDTNTDENSGDGDTDSTSDSSDSDTDSTSDSSDSDTDSTSDSSDSDTDSTDDGDSDSDGGSDFGNAGNNGDSTDSDSDNDGGGDFGNAGNARIGFDASLTLGSWSLL